MADIDAVLARVSDLERAIVTVTEAQKSGRWVLPIVIGVFVGVGGILGALNVYSIARIDTVGDRVSDTRDQATETGANVTVLTGRFDAIDKTVTQIDVSVSGLKDRMDGLDRKADFLTSTTTSSPSRSGSKRANCQVFAIRTSRRPGFASASRPASSASPEAGGAAVGPPCASRRARRQQRQVERAREIEFIADAPAWDWVHPPKWGRGGVTIG